MKKKTSRPNAPSFSKIVAYWEANDGEHGFEPKLASDWVDPACMLCGLRPFYYDEVFIRAGLKMSELEYGKGRYKNWRGCGLHKAHLHCYAHGGSNDPSNFIVACRSCNAFMPQFNDRIDALKVLAISKFYSLRFCMRAELVPTMEFFVEAMNEIRELNTKYNGVELPPTIHHAPANCKTMVETRICKGIEHAACAMGRVRRSVRPFAAYDCAKIARAEADA